MSRFAAEARERGRSSTAVFATPEAAQSALEVLEVDNPFDIYTQGSGGGYASGFVELALGSGREGRTVTIGSQPAVYAEGAQNTTPHSELGGYP